MRLITIILTMMVPPMENLVTLIRRAALTTRITMELILRRRRLRLRPRELLLRRLMKMMKEMRRMKRTRRR